MGATAGEAARESLGVRGESGASRASPLCGVRLRAGAGVAGGTGVHFRAASAAGGSTVVAGRLGSARRRGTPAPVAGRADAGKVRERRRAVSMD